MGNNLVVVEQETLKDLISDAVFAAMQDYKDARKPQRVSRMLRSCPMR